MSLYVRSALFLVWFSVISVALNVVCLPLLIFPWRATVWAANKWARLILFGLDRSEGNEAEPSTPQRLFLTCKEPDCLHQADYSLAKVSRYQRNQDGALNQEQP